MNDVQVEPLVSLLDPLMSWAEEAHWSMGSFNFESLRPQGHIKDIQAEHERSVKKKEKHGEIEQIGVKFAKSLKLSRSPPPAPLKKRRRRFENVKGFPARKLWDDIDKEAEECGMKEISGSEGASTRSPSAKATRSPSVRVYLH